MKMTKEKKLVFLLLSCDTFITINYKKKIIEFNSLIKIYYIMALLKIINWRFYFI